MAKLALINREAKRRATVAKFAAKRAALKAIINDATRSMDERLEARAKLEKLPAMRARSACIIAAPSPAVPAAISVSLVCAAR